MWGLWGRRDALMNDEVYVVVSSTRLLSILVGTELDCSNSDQSKT